MPKAEPQIESDSETEPQQGGYSNYGAHTPEPGYTRRPLSEDDPNLLEDDPDTIDEDEPLDNIRPEGTAATTRTSLMERLRRFGRWMSPPDDGSNDLDS